MFTGIVEELGIIKSIRANSQGLDIIVSADKIFDDLKVGDSVAINGCCQTVTSLWNKEFTVQAVNETLKLTTFRNLKYDEKPNYGYLHKLIKELGNKNEIIFDNKFDWIEKKPKRENS